jgi:hypothetical protein
MCEYHYADWRVILFTIDLHYNVDESASKNTRHICVELLGQEEKGDVEMVSIHIQVFIYRYRCRFSGFMSGIGGGSLLGFGTM